eukprot:4711260-Prymnesium_polylepis.1
MAAGAMATAEGPWDTVLSEAEKNTLNADATKDLEEQGAPDIDALVITSVCLMLARKCGVSEEKCLFGAQSSCAPSQRCVRPRP